MEVTYRLHEEFMINFEKRKQLIQKKNEFEKMYGYSKNDITENPQYVTLLQLLHREEENLRLDRLGLQDDQLIQLESALNQSQGFILVTGPTGSGKTQTLYTSNYDSNTGINQNIQRFLQSIQYSGKIVSEGGAESQPQYLERGNYWHFDFSKDKNDTSSYVNVQLGFNGTIGPGNNLFIVAHYSRQCEISYENGFITQVVSVNR
jgi:hypothetical protein